MKKLLTKENSKNGTKNVVVEVVLLGTDKKKYESICVLVKEDTDSIRIAFNAKKGILLDFLDIKRKDVLSIRLFDSSKITKM